MAKQLKRSSTDKVLMGVCGGMGEYFDMDSNLMRLLWVLGTVFSAGIFGVIGYIVLGVVLPED